MSTTYRFPVIKATRKHTLTCPTCGRRFTRQRTFESTVNPFNRSENGTPRSPHEVREQVNAKADAWEPQMDHCETKEEA